jgi:hypothetical protein
MESDSEDSRHMRIKHGYQYMSHQCFQTALLLRFAERYSKQIPGFSEQVSERGILRIFTPFMANRNAMVDTLIMSYIIDMPKVEISRRLLDRPEIAKSRLTRMIHADHADYAILPEAEWSNTYYGVVERFNRSILKLLGDHQFTGPRYVLENGHVALNFAKVNGSGKQYQINIVTDNHPPLVIHRRDSREQDIYSIRDAKELWQKLYQTPFAQRDDKTRMMTNTEVRLPIDKDLYIPPEVFADYGTALKYHFKDNMPEFKRRLYAARAAHRLDDAEFRRVIQIINS